MMMGGIVKYGCVGSKRMSMCAAVTALEQLQVVYIALLADTRLFLLSKTGSTTLFLHYAKDQDTKNKTATRRL